jgi:hypothetical protein
VEFAKQVFQRAGEKDESGAHKSYVHKLYCKRQETRKAKKTRAAGKN